MAYWLSCGGEVEAGGARLYLGRDPEKWEPVFRNDHALNGRPVVERACGGRAVLQGKGIHAFKVRERID
jgi:lipoate-protein ligase A